MLVNSKEHPYSPETWSSAYKAEGFSGVPSNEWYGVVDVPGGPEARKEAKEAFLADETLREPQLTYPKLMDIDFKHTETVYQTLLVQSMGMNEAVADSFYEQAAIKLAELYRHKEVIRRLGGVANTALSVERAAKMTLEIFGAPEKREFDHILASLRTKAEMFQADSVVAQEFLAMTGDPTPETAKPNYELSDSALTTFFEDLQTIIPNFDKLWLSESVERLSPEASMEHMQHVMNLLGMSDKGWVAKTVDGSSAAETSATERKVTVGRDKANYLPAVLNTTTIHEVIGHGYRAFQASQQNDVAKRYSQPGSLGFEEGFATGLEQVLSGKKRIAGEQYYLSLGLQLGLDRDGESRDFRDIFEILWRRAIVNNLANGEDADVQKAKNTAYSQAMRTTRGGASDARDISYYLGAQKAYPWMNEVAQLPKEHRVQIVEKVLSGRFDPTNPEQAELFRIESILNTEVAL